ncbi:MAG: purine-nucleoside phosphorylase, partial [Candidatus Marinimicrobia bacterium]|nr:purine-nucleoside phosphorylase [Candidatus Neomarinimicrobiota bacterium]
MTTAIPATQAAQEAAAAVRARLGPLWASPSGPDTPRVAIILGSGLGDFADTLSDSRLIPYDEIPHYPQPAVPGHAGQLVYGRAGDLPVMAARGRIHYYEGHSLETVAFPIHLFARLGVQTLIITNAAGCINADWNVGDLMLITGHLDYTFLGGPDDPATVLGEPHHSQRLLDLARRAAREGGIPVREGVYAWTLGPSYETPAEIRHMRSLGAAAVGMSTVPEIRAAADEGLEVLALSCLTNYAAGIQDRPLSHDDVLETGQRVQATFARLVRGVL